MNAKERRYFEKLNRCYIHFRLAEHFATCRWKSHSVFLALFSSWISRISDADVVKYRKIIADDEYHAVWTRREYRVKFFKARVAAFVSGVLWRLSRARMIAGNIIRKFHMFIIDYSIPETLLTTCSILSARFYLLQCYAEPPVTNIAFQWELLDSDKIKSIHQPNSWILQQLQNSIFYRERKTIGWYFLKYNQCILHWNATFVTGGSIESTKYLVTVLQSIKFYRKNQLTVTTVSVIDAICKQAILHPNHITKLIILSLQTQKVRLTQRTMNL